MSGARLTILTMALAASLITSAVRAADYQQPSPQVYVQPPPQVIESFSETWYLRGDVGIGMNNVDIEYLPTPAHVGNGFAFDQHSIANTVFIGGGIGYEFNNWLRFDGTAEYRSKTQVNARGVYNPITFDGDAYQGYLKSWVFLANAYVDLGTWYCFTPFVGAGIGTTYNTLADFNDMGIGTTGHGFGRNSSEWHLAWALHAGVAYNVSKNLKVELAYRYLNLGSVTDTIDCVADATCSGGNADSYKLNNIHSHDIMLGLRWTCCETPPAPRYVYSPPPPPVYTEPPPPLRSKG
jgi:opacity protein-like surface antigen